MRIRTFWQNLLWALNQVFSGPKIPESSKPPAPKIPRIGDNVWVHEKWVGKTAPARVLRRMGDAFLVQYLGKNGKPRGAVSWNDYTLLSVIEEGDFSFEAFLRRNQIPSYNP